MALVFQSISAATDTGWQRLAPLPEGNGGFVAGAIGETIIAAGGTTWRGETKHWLDVVWAYDPARNAWRSVGHLSAPVAYAAVGQDARAVFFVGGSSGTKTHPTLWRIDAQLAPKSVADLSDGVVYAGGALIGSMLFVIGGSDHDAKLERLTNAFRAIDVQTGRVRRLPDYPESAFSNGGVCAIGREIFVFGGARWDAANARVANHQTAHVFSLATERWTSLPPLSAANRGIAAVALDERHIVLAGGYKNDDEEFTADMFLFDTKGSSYRRIRPLPYAGMVGLVKSGEWLYCVGGEDKKRHRTDAVYRIRWKKLIEERP